MLRRARKKRSLSLTSLIDVIFLLLLFFMLTSTFSKFAEIPLSAALAGNTDQRTTPPIFLQLFPDRVTVNGEAAALNSLSLSTEPGQTLLIALQDGVSAQRLTDALVALRGFPDLTISVLGAG